MGIILLILLSLFLAIGQGFDIEYFWPNITPESQTEEATQGKTSSIVKIRGYSNNIPNRVSEGTGFIVSSDGDILTNRHVVNGNNVIYKVTTIDGFTYDVQNIYKSSSNDIAVIDVNPEQNNQKELTPIELGDSNEVDPGEPISALVNDPGKIKPTYLTGTVINTDDSVMVGRSRRSAAVLNDLIITDLDLKPGNSGGPLIDKDGKAVGINTATSTMGNISFSIPINEAKEFWQTTNG